MDKQDRKPAPSPIVTSTWTRPAEPGQAEALRAVLHRIMRQQAQQAHLKAVR